MRRLWGLIALCLAAFSLPIASGQAQSGFTTETLALDSHDGADDGSAGPVSTSQNLDSGVDYTVTIDGTYSAWSEDTWDNPGGCGTPEPAPERSSAGVTNGPVSHDAEFLLTEPAWGGEDCSFPVPREDALVRIDVGSGPARVEPIGGIPDDPTSGHEYQYRITGQGQPARFEIVEDPTSDNYGVLTITVHGRDPVAGLLTPLGCVDDNDTGPEECASSTDGLDRPRSVVVSPDGRSVYVISELDHAIVHFDRDTTTGALTPRGCIEDNDSGPDACSRSTDGLQGAIEVAISPDGESVYAASIVDDAIVHFSRNTSTGALTAEGCVDDNDSGPDACRGSADGLDFANTVVVSPDGQNVYAGGQEDDAVVVFNRDTDGDLTSAGCIDDNDTGADTCSQSADGLDGVRTVAVSPDGTSLYTASFRDDGAVAHFSRDASTGALTSRGCIDDNDSGADACAQSTNGLAGAHSVTVSSDGRSVYAVGVHDHALVRFDRDAGSGGLRPRGCIDDNDSGADECSQSADGLATSAWVAVSPNGELVLVAATEPDHALTAFNRNTSSGAITPAGCVDDNDVGSDRCAQTTDGLQQGIFLAFSPDGGFAYVVGYDDDAVSVFQINASGRPQQCRDADAICGGSGNEELRGTPEDEFIFGGGGSDQIDGGGGNDVIVGGAGRDVIDGGPGKDKITGGAGKDRIVGDGNSAPDPSAQDAWVSAAQSAASADQLSGGGGNDTVLGQAGNDKLLGDAGNDTLKGGGGVNNFNGGAGKDLCVLENKKDKTQSCERKKLNFKLNFWP